MPLRLTASARKVIYLALITVRWSGCVTGRSIALATLRGAGSRGVRSDLLWT